MSDYVRATSAKGESIEFEGVHFSSGVMKDVHWDRAGRDVVAFFRDPLDGAGLERIRAIVDVHRARILEGPGGGDLAALYRWPRDTVEYQGKLGLVIPRFDPAFFFAHGSANNDMLSIKGKEKQGKWFASARHRSTYLDPRERGEWIDYLRICIRIARAVRRLHAAGLAHSDLSYKNVLVDPLSGSACIIDIDGLVVPGKFPPDVVGTPEFIAPEVVMTQDLPLGDDNKNLPSIQTDRHALAVLIYMYLLSRHPLDGRKIHDPDDAARDNALQMGERALWVEHPQDDSNRIDLRHVNKAALPWADTQKLPYTLCGPRLAALFEQAFIDGLHEPAKRPTAEEWERALILTADMLIPCNIAGCNAGMYVFDNSRRPHCPLCQQPYDHVAPILNLYSSRGSGDFRPDNHRVTVFDGLSLYPWHANRFVFPSERLTGNERQRMAYVRWHDGAWHLVNERLPDMLELPDKKPIAPGQGVVLSEGKQILLSREDGGRLISVQVANG
ncbi:MAG: lipopolysaccharide kinase InaA family protein [Pseudomonadota bacterium]